MRKDPTVAEIIENEVATEAHQLVLAWQQERSEWFKRDVAEIVEGFAEWMLTRRPPAGDALNDLAKRLHKNPALTANGTLAIILDGIDRIPDEWLARSLAHVNARQQGLAVSPLSDEDWAKGDLQAKVRLLQAARSLKEALREASKL
jgi:hypothetical protein